MPYYEYLCADGHKFEVRRPMDDRTMPMKCQDCRGIARLVPSVPAQAQFGWRLTDAAHERFGPREEVEKDV